MAWKIVATGFNEDIPFDIFHGLTKDQRLAIARCPLYMTCPAGTEIFGEGEPAYGLFHIRRGAVEIYRRRKDRGEISLARLGPGEIFGEIGMLIETGTRTASARALEFTEVITVDADPKDFLLQVGDIGATITLMQNLVRLLAHRLREQTKAFPDESRRRTPILRMDHPGQEQTLEKLKKTLPKKGLFTRVAREQTLNAGGVLFRQGDQPDGFYFIHEGALDVCQESEEDEPLETIARMEAPNIVGEMGFFAGQKRSATLRAVTDITYTHFSGKDFERLKKNSLEEAAEVLHGASRQVVHLILDNAPV